MTNLTEKEQWEDGVYQIEKTDPVVGGPDGLSNRQGQQLANRTKYLKGLVDALLNGTRNAALAVKLATARAIGLSGDASGSANFDGSANATINVTLASTGIAAGTYGSLTVDGKGRATAGSTITPIANGGTGNSTGLAASATKLATARTINGVPFDGTGNIVVADSTKAPLDSPTLTGTPKAPTPAAGSNTEQLATTAFVQAALAALVNGSPEALNQLNELAAALGNNPNFATDIATALGLKANLASPTLTGTPTAPTAADGTATTQLATTDFVQKAMAVFGLGSNTAPMVTDLNAVALNGISRYLSTAANVPAAANGILLNIQFNVGGQLQLACTLTSTTVNAKLYWRASAGGNWSAWREVTPLDSPAFTGNPTAPTAAVGDNDTSIATTAFVQAAIQAFGVGTSQLPTLTDIDAYQATGIYRVATVDVPNIPVASAGCIINLRYNLSTYAAQIYITAATTASVSNRVFWRTNNNGAWTAWREFGGLDSPAFTGNPTAPTPAVGDNDTSIATTAFVQAALAAFGVGTAQAPTSTDASAITVSGMYRMPYTASNIPIGTSGVLIQENYDSSSFSQLFVSTAGTSPRMFARSKFSTGDWTAWREVGFLDSPAFTGTPTAPTAARGTTSTQLATAAFVQDAAGTRTGEVVLFPVSSPPAGFLKANGAAVSRTTYAALFAVIGTTFGTGDGSSTFNLPDLRGEFLRGWDDGRGVDSSRTLGSVQASQNLSHNHTATTSTAGAHQHTLTLRQDRAPAGDGNAVFGDEAYYSPDATLGTSTAGDHIHTVTVASSGGNEARPRNVALLACIKF